MIKQAIIRSLIFLIFPVFVDQEVGVSTYTVEMLNKRFIAQKIEQKNHLYTECDPKP